MAASKVLFCEGKPGGLDAIALRVVCSGLGAVIRPVGGKGNLRSYVYGYSQDRPISYVAIRDRDFEREPDSPDPDLTSLGEQFFMWGRHEIENYLVESSVLAAVYEQARSWPGLAHLSACDEFAIASCLDSAARGISFFQAGRWALGQLRPSGGWPYLPNRWVNERQLPTDMTESACHQATRDQVGKYQHSLSGVRPDQAIQLFDKYSQRFSEPTFYDRREYLTWFSGKDLFLAFCTLANSEKGIRQPIV